MDKGFVPQPSCNPKLMEVPVEKVEVEMKGDDELKEPVNPLDKHRGKPWFREIVKLDMECRIIQLLGHTRKDTRPATCTLTRISLGMQKLCRQTGIAYTKNSSCTEKTGGLAGKAIRCRGG